MRAPRASREEAKEVEEVEGVEEVKEEDPGGRAGFDSGPCAGPAGKEDESELLFLIVGAGATERFSVRDDPGKPPIKWKAIQWLA